MFVNVSAVASISRHTPQLGQHPSLATMRLVPQSLSS